VTGHRPDDPFPPAGPLLETAFVEGEMTDVRKRLKTVARGCGLTADRANDWITAVNELMANAIRHGNGGGQLRVWRNEDLYCEVRDQGPGFDPAPYRERRERPVPSAAGGMGLWIAQQMSQGLRIDSGPSGTVVLLRTSLIS
jgi:serine/threonine-protein kinase RsbW